MDKLLEMKLDGVSFEHLASVYEKYTGKIAVENLRPSWLIFSPGFKKSRFQQFAKRALDIFVALVGLIVARAGDAPRGRCSQADVPRPCALFAAASRTGRPRLHRPQVPIDAGGRGEGHRRGVGPEG